MVNQPGDSTLHRMRKQAPSRGACGNRDLFPLGYASVPGVSMSSTGMGLLASWVLVLFVTSVAYADDDDSLPAGSQPEYGVMPMASQGSDKRLERRLSRQGVPKQDRRRTSPSAILGLQGGVPIYVGSDVDRDDVSVGGSFNFIMGADLGYFVPEIDVGYMANQIDLTAGDSEPLQRVHLGIGGRFQFPNASVLIPYLSAKFAAQWWKLNTLPTCNFFACGTGDGFRFAPGLKLGVGTTISFARSAAVDIGLRYGISFTGDTVFPETRHWIEPTFGFRFWL